MFTAHSTEQERVWKWSVPELDGAVPAAGGHLARLVRVPQHADAHVVVRLPLGRYAVRLPVPDEDLAVRVARYHVPARQNKLYIQLSI